MVILMSMLWICLLTLFFIVINRVLLTLLLIEVIAFLIIVFLSYTGCMDSTILLVFITFVIEGVVALTAMIILVSYSGSDYISSISFLL